ncbi:MAG: hypothetical protein WCA79_19065 [Anaerolineales bacterium]
MLLRKVPYHEAGADFFDRLNSGATAQRLVKRLQQLSYAVEGSLLPVSVAA